MSSRAARAVLFLEQEVPRLLLNLAPDTKPGWGLMTPQHMLEHLQYTIGVSTGVKPARVVSPWLVRPFLKLFILGHRPFPRNIKMPGQKERKLLPLKHASLTEAKMQLQQAIIAMLRQFEQEPNLRTNHPFAGPFSPADWQVFHQRHFTHHFVQFGLLPDYKQTK